MTMTDVDSPVNHVLVHLIKQLEFFGLCGGSLTAQKLKRFVPRLALLTNLLEIPEIGSFANEYSTGKPYIYNKLRWTDSAKKAGYLSANSQVDIRMQIDSLLMMWNMQGLLAIPSGYGTWVRRWVR